MTIAASSQARISTDQLLAKTIVVIGKFDTSLLQPSALFDEGLLNETDLKKLTIRAFFPEVCMFELPWIHVRAEQDKLTLTAPVETPVLEPVRDFLITLLEFSPPTALRALGVNLEHHFPLETEDKWHSFGHSVAPKEELWSKISNKPGLMSLQIRGQRDDGFEGNLNYWVEPSVRVKYGIFLRVNDHYDFSSEDGVTMESKLEKVADLLTNKWADVVRRQDSAMQMIKEYAERE